MSAFHLGTYEQEFRSRLERFAAEGGLQRLWERDTTLFRGQANDRAVADFMGWLDSVDRIAPHLDMLQAFASELYGAGFRRAVLAGMGGSSLAPLVFASALGPQEGGLRLDVLDSTDPSTVRSAWEAGSGETSLYVIASKSGSTAEPAAFDAYLYNCWPKGDHFVAITDPGSELSRSASARGFRRIFENWADIGGRFSALSFFGMVPAALLGLDLRRLIQSAAAARDLDGAAADPWSSPGVRLGVACGVLATLGRDKLTIITPEPLATFGLWLEQLIAESTGKEGKGVFPVAGEPHPAPTELGADRVVAYLRLPGYPELDATVAALEAAGTPVVRSELHDMYDIPGVMYHWMIATAVMGSILGVNPFDQPNVQESKTVTVRVLADVASGVALPEVAPMGASALAKALRDAVAGKEPPAYVALHAYLTETSATSAALSTLQGVLRSLCGCAVSAGYGPRFLHSTGQYHKGGPKHGLFLQLYQVETSDLAIPGKPYSFGVFRDAQGIGDRQALHDKGLEVVSLRIDQGVTLQDIVAEIRAQ